MEMDSDLSYVPVHGWLEAIQDCRFCYAVYGCAGFCPLMPLENNQLWRSMEKFSAVRLECLLEQQREITVKYYEGLQDRYEETQRLLHDVKKHIRVLNELKSFDESIKTEYTNELLDSIENIQP